MSFLTVWSFFYFLRPFISLFFCRIVHLLVQLDRVCVSYFVPHLFPNKVRTIPKNLSQTTFTRNYVSYSVRKVDSFIDNGESLYQLESIL